MAANGEVTRARSRWNSAVDATDDSHPRAPLAPPAARLWSRLAAAIYDPFLALGERRGMRERRRRLLQEARGRVLEIGAGTGLNLAHYPDELDELLLSEPVGPMARRLESRLRRSGVRGRVLHAGAEALPVATGSIDTVVSTLVLCTVPDPEAALAEIQRVLRPDGRLLFCEHVRSDSIPSFALAGPAGRRMGGLRRRLSLQPGDARDPRANAARRAHRAPGMARHAGAGAAADRRRGPRAPNRKE